MRIFNIMMSRDLGGIQQSFLDYDAALRMEGHKVINLTSFSAKINQRLPQSIKLPNLGPWCVFSRLYLRILIMIYQPDLLLAHGGRAINFAHAFKPDHVPLVGIAHNYKTGRLKNCDYIITITNILISYLTELGFDKKKLFHAPNMYKIKENYQERQYKNPIIIGSFGRFVAKKGFNYLLEAVHLLKCRGYNVRLLLGGEGEEEENLKKQVHDLNLVKEVSFVGWVEDKKKFFEKIDIFCLPSTSEPFGIILLEAMESSTPIVATKSGGPAEILRESRDALLAAAHSSAEIADKLAVLLQDPARAIKLSSSAYLRLSNNYDIKVVAKKLSKILTQIKIESIHEFST